VANIAYVQELGSTTNVANTSGVGGASYDSLTAQGVFRTGFRPVFENFRGDIYLGGPYTRVLVRHATDRSWLLAGIKPPQDAVVVQPGTGSGGSSGDCLAYITFLHKEGNRVLVESNPSNIVDVGTLSGEGRDWSNIQNTFAELRVTHVRGYVSMNGAAYRMAWEAPYGVTAVSENVRTSRLSLQGPNDFNNDIPPIGIRYIHPWAQRMWYANNAEFPYRLWYSKPGYPQYVGSSFFLDTLEREPITGLWRGRNELVVFCQDNSYLVRQFGQGANDFVMERLDSNVGCVSHHTIKEIHNRLWFAARDGIWIYDGSFRYVLDDMRPKYESDYCKDKASFESSFSVYDKLNKVYMLFRTPTLQEGEDPPEWEPKTGLYPRTIIYVGYIGEFEPSMNGQELQPDWSFDFRGRQDSSSLYAGSVNGGQENNELYVASCDGKIRRQIKPCELEQAREQALEEPPFVPTWWGGDDDEDSLQKKLIIRHPHLLFQQPGDDIQSGKRLDQVWSHMESEITDWTFYAMGGDEDAWDSVRPDNDRHFWKADHAASADVQTRTNDDGSVYSYEYCAKAVHFMLPEQVAGRGFTFEVQALEPVGMKYRGVGGMWSPGPAHRPPRDEALCDREGIDIQVVAGPLAYEIEPGGFVLVSALDVDNGSVGAAFWELRLVNPSSGKTVASSGAVPVLFLAEIEVTCELLQQRAGWTARLVGHSSDPETPAQFACGAYKDVSITVSDPGGFC
jgi:hypothetical protein